MTAEYPQVFAASNRQNLRFIGDGENILAHAAIKYLLIKNILGIFKVAAIGSVVTDPDHRNQGLSNKIIENCLMSAEQEGADFAILWTDLYDFYRKMGFDWYRNQYCYRDRSSGNNLWLKVSEFQKKFRLTPFFACTLNTLAELSHNRRY